MEFHHFDLAGPVEIVPRRLGDARGWFCEVFRLAPFADQVGTVDFVQENESLSARAGTVRGLHFQTPPVAQGKLVRCTAGAIFDVAVDLRSNSATYGQWISATLTPERGNQLWVPPGFAHGFCTLKPDSVVNYKVTAYYSAEHDKGVAWDDPAIGVVWPAEADPETLSAKDRVQPSLAEIPAWFGSGDLSQCA
jgi:dTDP-4-dehydrorhamnose 3,5-epimerase